MSNRGHGRGRGRGRKRGNGRSRNRGRDSSTFSKPEKHGSITDKPEEPKSTKQSTKSKDSRHKTASDRKGKTEAPKPKAHTPGDGAFFLHLLLKLPFVISRKKCR